jgi:guanosine-3',5'-bis(diphosphate) 3'-pyrophosphohydrolase
MKIFIDKKPDFDFLKKRVLDYNPEAKIELIKKAYDLAEKAHSKQKRADGSPYFIHPYNVSLILTELKMDSSCICAALLHDVVEDTDIELEYLSENFSPVIATLVNGVTKISKLAFKSRLEFQAENIKKMLLAMAEDVRVVIIKLADRLHNIATLGALRPDKQKRIAKETLDIYAPLAHRLGIHGIKSLLEDYSLAALEPETYKKIEEKVAKKISLREEHIKEAIDTIKKHLKANNIKAKVYGRAKHNYSIYLKMVRNSKSIDEIYDLIAVRIVTNSVRNCYSALGTMHSIWAPMPGRFKDYIAMPKSNGYQSLHTTVMQKINKTGEAVPLEIQIRTYKMDEVAETGIAAHWDYKERNNHNDKKGGENKDKISWLRQLIDWHTEIQDAADFLHNLKNDLFHDEVFVFTPAGDVVSLPFSATPLDFAFIVHTEVGLKCVGAKVNGKIVSLDYSLADGDVIEIITSANAHPNHSWLNIVKSHKAKNKIRQYLRKQEKLHFNEIGKKSLMSHIEKMAKEFAKYDNIPIDLKELSFNNLCKSDRMKKYLEKSDLHSLDMLFTLIGRDELSPISVFNKLFPEWNQFKDAVNRLKQLKNRSEKKERSTDGVIVEGIDNPMINFSKCCHPLPGEPIIGYITRGRGISIHRKNCPNLKSLIKEKERLIKVRWDKDSIKKATFISSVRLEVDDRPNMLFDITHIVSSVLKLNIANLSAKTNRKGGGIIDLQIEISKFQDLDEVIKNIKKIKGVINVYRLK